MNESKKTIRQREYSKEVEIVENIKPRNDRRTTITAEIEKVNEKKRKKKEEENKMIQYEVIDYARKSVMLMNTMKQNEKKLNQLSHTNYDNNLKNVFKIKYDQEFIESRQQMKRLGTKEINNQIKELESEILKKTNDYFKESVIGIQKSQRAQKTPLFNKMTHKRNIKQQSDQKINKVNVKSHWNSTEASNSVK